MDLGLRKDHINFRQYEKSHLMENLIYNKMRVRGFNVDVRSVPIINVKGYGRRQRSTLEVNLVCNLESRRYYIQSACRMGTDERVRQERASLLKVDDSFKKIIVIGEESPTMNKEKAQLVFMFFFLMKILLNYTLYNSL